MFVVYLNIYRVFIKVMFLDLLVVIYIFDFSSVHVYLCYEHIFVVLNLSTLQFFLTFMQRRTLLFKSLGSVRFYFIV